MQLVQCTAFPVTLIVFGAVVCGVVICGAVVGGSVVSCDLGQKVV